MFCARAYVWLTDKSPATNFNRSEVISVSSFSTPNTEELILGLAIGFINITTIRTGTTGVARVNKDHRHTSTFALVLDKALQLIEGPTMQNRALALPSRYPFADTLEIFKGDTASGVLSGFHDLLRDNVVDIGCIAPFLTRQALQLAAGAIGLLALQLFTQTAVTVTNILDALALMKCLVTIYRDVGDTYVDTQKFIGFDFWRFFNIAGLEQVELAIAINQIAFATKPLQERKLLFTAHKRHFLSSTHRPNTDDLRSEFVGHQAFVEREGGKNLKSALRFIVQLVGVGNFGEHTHNYIRAQAKALTNVFVAQPMQRELPKYLLFPGDVAHEVTGGIGSLKRLLKQGVLFGRRLQLELSNQFHKHIVPSIGELRQSRKDSFGFPTRLKPGVPAE